MADIDLGFVKGNVIKTGTTAPSSALDGDLFYNTSTYHIYQWDASLSTPTWVDKGSIRGPKGDKGDTGPSVTIDSALSSTSTNPVQNKVINMYLPLIRESEPTSSTSPNESRLCVVSPYSDTEFKNSLYFCTNEKVTLPLSFTWVKIA